jgi:aryl-phospho-beta-D-glucosidase BglC (GH1 family)
VTVAAGPGRKLPVLRQRGSEIVDETGNAVLLRGVGLGGWMNMENFITGYPANEESMRAAVRRELGDEKYEFFFDRFLEYFFGDDDAAFLHSLGLNLVRLPINYRHFESDLEPFHIREEGFKHLDRVVDCCARHGIYTIIDLHAVQGYQNQDWHSDNPTHRSLLWSHRHFQDRAAHLWEVIADRYRGNRWVAGYNPINEPNDPDGEMFVPVTRRLYDTVQAVDPDHLVFLDANAYGSDFSPFRETWPNVVYSFHDYALCGFVEGRPYPGYTGSVWCDRDWLERHFLKKSAYPREHGAPMWVGEFGPVYTGERERDQSMYTLVRDQIDLFERYGAHWTIWTYKDVGLQGLVYASPDSPWVKLHRPLLAQKEALATDSWGSTGETVADLLQPIEERLARVIPEESRPFGGTQTLAKRLISSILFAEALLPSYAALFRGLSEDELDALARSFSFESCIVRTPLAETLSGTPAGV